MSLSGANAVITLTQPILFPNGAQLQGFGVDDVTDIDGAKVLEAMMGVDGVLSFGFVWVERRHKITLMADSASNDFFDTINTQQEAVQDVYPLSGVVILPAISRMFNLINGGLETYKPMPHVQRTIKQREYYVVWNKVVPVPITS